MKPVTIIGIVLIVIGVIALAGGGLTYTEHKKIFDVGPIEGYKDKKQHILDSPVLGGLALVGGVVLVVAATRKRD